MLTNYYIYCITPEINENIVCELRGYDNQEIVTVYYRDICACTSKTNASSLEPNLENLQCHEKVIGNIMEKYPVLPLSFSTICKTKDSVNLFLEKYYDQFKKNLVIVEGKVELGIKIFYKLDFEKEDRLDKVECKSAKDYMFKRFDRYRDRKMQQEIIASVGEKIHIELNKISSQSTYKKPFRNNLIFNGSYLVEKHRVAEFLMAVEKLKQENTTYKIVFSGPWSPYHFVSIIKEGEVDE